MENMAACVWLTQEKDVQQAATTRGRRMTAAGAATLRQTSFHVIVLPTVKNKDKAIWFTITTSWMETPQIHPRFHLLAYSFCKPDVFFSCFSDANKLES